MLISSSLLLFTCTTQNKLHTQPGNDTTVYLQTYNTTQQVSNQITNGQALQPLKEKINKIDSSLVLIKVLHIGDSHLRSGHFSQPFMEKLNKEYAAKFNGNLFFNFETFCKVGTKYSDYSGLAELDAQLLQGNYDLIIISLGTNDAFSGSAKINFYEKVDHLITKIKTLSPKAAVLLTTPPDGLKKIKGVFTALPDLENVVNVIIQYANDHNLAYWDLHQIMGGTYTINSWYQQKLAAADRVHFTAKGYNLFADWLFDAFTACFENTTADTINF